MQKQICVNIFKSVVFLILITMLLSRAISILNYKDMGGGGGWKNLYSTPEETIDVMFFGNSHMHCTIDHGCLWDKYGIAGYTLSAGAQQIDSTYYFIKEAIEVQKPKVIVVDVYGALWEIDNSEETVYRNTLGMRYSANLWNFVKHMAESMEEDFFWQLKTFGKMFHIHSRYAELEQEDFKNELPFMKGYRGSFDVVSFEKPNRVAPNETLPLDTECEEYLYKIIELSKSSETELVFIAAPFVLSDEYQMKLNQIGIIAEKQGVPFINYNNLYEDILLDFSVDMRDTDHLNNSGAQKVTEHLAQFLAERYELPDRRGQKEYESWNKNSKYLQGKYLKHQLYKCEDVNQYLNKCLELEDYTVIITLNGNHTALGDVYFNTLNNMNITYEEYLQGGAWIFKDGKLESVLLGKDYDYRYLINGKEIKLKSIQYTDDVGDPVEEFHFYFDEKDNALIENGIHILVYDHEIDQLIDQVGVDIYLGLDLLRIEDGG